MPKRDSDKGKNSEKVPNYRLTDSQVEKDVGLGSRLGKRRKDDDGKRQTALRSADGMFGLDSSRKSSLKNSIRLYSRFS